jgi:hypothetical protein
VWRLPQMATRRLNVKTARLITPAKARALTTVAYRNPRAHQLPSILLRVLRPIKQHLQPGPQPTIAPPQPRLLRHTQLPTQRAARPQNAKTALCITQKNIMALAPLMAAWLSGTDRKTMRAVAEVDIHISLLSVQPGRPENRHRYRVASSMASFNTHEPANRR